MSGRIALASVIVTVIVLAIFTLTDRDQQPEGAALLPDLWSSAPFELQLSTLDSRQVLRFTTEINNQGDGAFMLRGNTRSGEFVQRFDHAMGGQSEMPVEVAVLWGGDTHYHWHIGDVARYRIERLDGSALDGAHDNKVGFCFFDGVDRLSGRPDAPPAPVHMEDGCGTRLDPDLDMGLSVGWGDQYRFDLRGQFIDIDGLPPGTYRLVAQVDPDGLFVESDTSNNTASTEFTLGTDADGGTSLSW